VCTFLFHTFINHSNTSESIEDTLREDVQKIINDTEKFDKDTTIYVKRGGIHSATWYNPHGARTASGLRFHKDSLTCAYNFSKMHSLLKVTNVNTNEVIIVKVTDRMGNKSSNHIDLSKCAFDSIGNPSSGRIKVIVEEIDIK
jgi:rare lipoprotein A